MARPGASPSRSLFVLLLSLAAVAACAHAQHDPRVDSAAQALNDEVTAFVEKATASENTPEGAYATATNQQFYADTQKKLAELKTLAEGEKSKEVVEQVQLISDNIENLRKLHELRGEKGLSKVLADPALKILQQQFKALATLQATLRANSPDTGPSANPNPAPSSGDNTATPAPSTGGDNGANPNPTPSPGGDNTPK